MCHYGHVKLTASEQKAVRKWYGVLLPVYASIALALLVAGALIQPPRQGALIAAADAPTAAKR